MISGLHAMIYSKHADRVRALLADAFELRSVDAGGGWPIFAAPPTEIAVHPADNGTEHELYLICDDIDATIAKLAERGVKSTPIVERDWGRATSLELAEGETIGMYEPRHPRP